jgi:di/tricarboxylate transporter
MSLFAGLDGHAIAVLVGMVFAFYVMTRELVPLTVTSLAIIAVLALGFHLFPYDGPRGALVPTDFFAGFGHEALIAICSLMVLGRGLVMTGALEPLARALAAIWRFNPTLAMFAVLLSCVMLSGILNDTPIVVLMTPVLMSLAARTGTSPGPLLMPMNFAVLIGGTATSIGTSTNLLVVSLAASLGAAQFGVFDFTPLVAIAAVPALIYLVVVAPRLLRGSGHAADDHAPREFSGVLQVTAGSYADERTVAEVVKRAAGISIRAVENADGRLIAKLPTSTVRAGFRLHVAGSAAALKECEALLGGHLSADDHAEILLAPDPDKKHDDLQLVEMIVSADSTVIGRRLGDLRFALNYGLHLLAVHAGQERPHNSDIRRWVLRAGDVLLVQGSTADIEVATRENSVLTLDGKITLPRNRKAPLAIGIMLGVVAVAATGLVAIAVAALIGAVLVLLTRCVLPRNLGRAVSAEIILLIPASLALGKALTVTGGADWIASLFLNIGGTLPIPLVLAGIIALMSVMTNFISNNAAAVIGTPISVAIASELGAHPEPFVLAVLFGCNLCFATPIGYQTNLIVMSAAGYRFVDFVRVGLPLTVLMIVVYSWLLPAWYGL